jgi:Mrr N-terminal domain
VKRIPHARGVDKALRSVRLAAQRALKGLNQAAGQQMSKGDYTAAEALAVKGKEIRQFQAEVEVVRKRWREVCGAGSRSSKKSVTPLWAYYQPVLKAIVHIGGECRRTDLEAQVARLMAESLQAGDRVAMARGSERWQIMVRRSRKALVAEGWIEDQSGPVWRITDAGRRAAEKPIGESGITRE